MLGLLVTLAGRVKASKRSETDSMHREPSWILGPGSSLRKQKTQGKSSQNLAQIKHLYYWNTDTPEGPIILFSNSFLIPDSPYPRWQQRAWTFLVFLPPEKLEIIRHYYSLCKMSYEFALEKRNISSTTFVLFGNVTNNWIKNDCLLIYILTGFIYK